MYTTDVFIGSIPSVEYFDKVISMKTNRYLKRPDLLAEVDNFPKLATQEAVARINWILDDKPLEDYEITQQKLVKDY